MKMKPNLFGSWIDFFFQARRLDNTPGKPGRVGCRRGRRPRTNEAIERVNLKERRPGAKIAAPTRLQTARQRDHACY